MNIHSVLDSTFAPYGRVVSGLDTTDLTDALNKHTPKPESGTIYYPSCPELESLPIFRVLRDSVYGGMPIQIGCCNGTNTILNCLEYHRDSELNLGTEDFILLFAKQEEAVDGVLDTEKVMAFRCPAGVLLEVYATTLHYAPCDAEQGRGFRVAVVLPEGTNTDRPADTDPTVGDGALLWARNKWLIAHPDSHEAKAGAFIGLHGENIDISKEISL